MYHIPLNQRAVLINQDHGSGLFIIHTRRQIICPFLSGISSRRYLSPAQQTAAKSHIYLCIPVKQLPFLIHKAYLQILIRHT